MEQEVIKSAVDKNLLDFFINGELGNITAYIVLVVLVLVAILVYRIFKSVLAINKHMFDSNIALTKSTVETKAKIEEFMTCSKDNTKVISDKIDKIDDKVDDVNSNVKVLTTRVDKLEGNCTVVNEMKLKEKLKPAKA